MRIAQISPLAESVPPSGYGGTERVVHWLTEELVRQGHEVTLFASGDSRTSARLVSCAPRSLRRQRSTPAEDTARHVAMVERVFERAPDFDVMHFHIDHLHLPLSERAGTPSVTTLHGRLDLPGLWPLFQRFAHLPFTTISDAQRRPMPWMRWRGTVHHGLPTDLYAASEDSGGYLLFLGRISPEKRCDRAIEIATRAGRRLLIAAKIDEDDRDYFEARIGPLLSRRGVEFLGEVGDRDKSTLLRGADALLFPIDWPEPFGLVMIEALACGTPVIAWPHGSVPEVIDDGITGHLVRSIDEGVRAVERIPALSRRTCREVFEHRFSPARMAEGYLRVYRALLGREAEHDPTRRARSDRDGSDGWSLPGAAGL